MLGQRVHVWWLFVVLLDFLLESKKLLEEGTTARTTLYAHVLIATVEHDSDDWSYTHKENKSRN